MSEILRLPFDCDQGEEKPFANLMVRESLCNELRYFQLALAEWLDQRLVKREKTETDYLPVAARIAWFRKDHPLWSIITEVEQLGNKAVVMKATIKDMLGTVIATARKKETEIGFPDYIEKAETGAIGRALAMCGYGTLQAPDFDEQDRLADAPVEKQSKS